MRAVGRRRRPRRARRRARARRRRPRGDAARGAADARRRRADAARARRRSRRRRPTTGSTSRSAASASTSRFLDRIGEAGALRRERLALPGRSARTGASPRSAGPALAPPLPAPAAPRAARHRARAASRCGSGARRDDDETFGELLRRLGSSERDDRPLLGRLRPAGAEPAHATRRAPRTGVFTVGPRCSAGARTATSSSRPGRSARCTATRPGGRSSAPARRSRTERARRRASTSSTRTASSSRAAGGVGAPARRARARRSRTRRSSASTCSSTGRSCRTPLAALLGSPAHWVFDRGALTGHRPQDGGQYLTVVSSGVPELLEIRGRELVDLMAGQLDERLGHAELVWSRVSREPRRDVRAPARNERARRARDRRPNVVRAGRLDGHGLAGDDGGRRPRAGVRPRVGFRREKVTHDRRRRS